MERGRLQCTVAAAANQLKGLSNKLDFTNTTGTQLNVSLHALTL